MGPVVHIQCISNSTERDSEIERLFCTADYQLSFLSICDEAFISPPLPQQRPHFILLNQAPNILPVLQHLKSIYPDTPILFICHTLDESQIVQVLKAGACHVVLRESLASLKALLSHRLLERHETTVKAPETHLELRNSEHILRAFLEESTDVIWVKDEQGRYLLINQAGSRFLGKPIDEIIGRDDTQVFSPDTAAKIRESDRAILEGGKTTTVEDLLVTLDGTRRTFLAMKGAYRNSHGQPQGVLGIVRDITERKQAEESLRKLEAELNTIFQSVPAMIWYKDKENRILRANKLAAESMGLSIEAIEGQSAFDLYPLDAQKYYTDELEVIQNGAAKLDVIETYHTPSGEERWIKSDKIPYRNEVGDIIGVIIYSVDITELQKAEAARQKSESLYRQLYQWEKQTREAVQSMRQSLDPVEIYPKLVEQVGRILEIDRCFVIHFQENEPRAIEYEYRKDPLIPSVLGLIPYQDAPFFYQIEQDSYRRTLFIEDLAREVQPQTSFSSSHRSHRFRGFIRLPVIYQDQLLANLILHTQPPRRWKEQEIYFLTTLTEQLAITLYQGQLVKELEKTTQLKSMFLANMSHELRTPLNAIIGYSEMLANGMGGVLSEKQQRYIQNVAASGRHLLTLVNNILDLSKVESGKVTLEYELFELPEIIKEVASILKTLADKKQICLQLDLDPQLKFALADPGRFKQILYNLLSNAIKFTENGGNVFLQGAMLEDQETLIIQVIDTGIGIAKADREKVFSEFVQIDNSYARKQEGTGLGLALTRGLVEMHGGTIDFESQEGLGTTFTVKIPCLVPPPATYSETGDGTAVEEPSDFSIDAIHL